MLLESNAHVIRVRLEANQGTLRHYSSSLSTHDDTSAMAQLSYMLYKSGGVVSQAGHSQAYYGLENVFALGKMEKTTTMPVPIILNQSTPSRKQ